MLSASSSFIATNCWVLILLASFAPIGGSADDRMTAPSTGGFGPGGSIRLAALAELLISAEAAVVLVMVAVVPGGNTASPARAEGDGKVPRGTVAVPNTEKNNMAEGRHGEKIFKMIVVPREDQDVADREVRYVCGCNTLLSEPPGTAGLDLQLARPGLRYCAAL